MVGSFLGIRDGNVWLRKKENIKAIAVHCVNDLEKLLRKKYGINLIPAKYEENIVGLKN